MNVISGFDVSLAFSLTENDESFTPQSIRIRVSGPFGVLYDWTTVPIKTNDEGLYAVNIPASVNTISSSREARIVDIEVDAGDEAGIQRLSQEYMVSRDSEELSLMVNSFQNYPMALTVASLISGTPGWDQATRDDRVVALMNSYNTLSRLSYRLLNDDVTYRSRAGWGLVPLGVGRLYEYNPSEFINLPADFKRKLLMAQVAEADTILTSDPIQNMRDMGVISERIGENVTTFSAGKQLTLGLNPRTFKMLTPYVSFSTKLARRG